MATLLEGGTLVRDVRLASLLPQYPTSVRTLSAITPSKSTLGMPWKRLRPYRKGNLSRPVQGLLSPRLKFWSWAYQTLTGRSAKVDFTRSLVEFQCRFPREDACANYSEDFVLRFNRCRCRISLASRVPPTSLSICAHAVPGALLVAIQSARYLKSARRRISGALRPNSLL